MNANKKFNEVITYKLSKEEIEEKFKDVKPYPKSEAGIGVIVSRHRPNRWRTKDND